MRRTIKYTKLHLKTNTVALFINPANSAPGPLDDVDVTFGQRCGRKFHETVGVPKLYFCSKLQVFNNDGYGTVF